MICYPMDFQEFWVAFHYWWSCRMDSQSDQMKDLWLEWLTDSVTTRGQLLLLVPMKKSLILFLFQQKALNSLTQNHLQCCKCISMGNTFCWLPIDRQYPIAFLNPAILVSQSSWNHFVNLENKCKCLTLLFKTWHSLWTHSDFFVFIICSSSQGNPNGARMEFSMKNNNHDLLGWSARLFQGLIGLIYKTLQLLKDISWFL